MAPTKSLALLSLLLLSKTVQAQYTPETAPETTQPGQTGTNKCGTVSSQESMCQNAYINSVDDFCLWAPPALTSDYGNSIIANTERIEVAWCLKSGYGTRVIPVGTITGAHFVKTPNYVQVTGVGDLTKLNIPAGDDGGELDPHGADGNGNPIGGLVFSSAFGNGIQQVPEWDNFMSSTTFCFRACTGAGAAGYCQHVYDVLGCNWNQPGDYSSGSFDNCAGDSAELPGVYGGSTFFQGQPITPAAHPAGATSQCTTFTAIGITSNTTSASHSATASSGSPSAPASASRAGASVSSPLLTASASASSVAKSSAGRRASVMGIAVASCFAGLAGALLL